jgi:hypothetical protein
MSKIPPKSPSTNFQSLGKFKNLIFIRKEIFISIRPNRPSGQPAHPAFQPSQPHRPPPSPRRPCARARPIPVDATLAYLQKSSLLRVCAARRRCLLPLSPPRGPRLSASSSPPRQPTPIRISPRRCYLRAAAPCLRCPRAFTALPHHSPPLIPFKPSVNRP